MSPVVQERIADLLDHIFARAERIETETARATHLLDRLEGAILAKAFQGELVPGIPADEPATLLACVRQSLEAQPKTKRVPPAKVSGLSSLIGLLCAMDSRTRRAKHDPQASLPSREGTGRALSPAFVARQFKKGQSGNPTGNKGSTYGEVVQIARQYSEKAVRRLIELVDSDDERVAFMASQALLDRAYGKPREHAEQSAIEAPKNEERRRQVVARMVADLNAMAAAVHAGVEKPGGCGAVPVLASPKGSTAKFS